MLLLISYSAATLKFNENTLLTSLQNELWSKFYERKKLRY